MRLLIKFLLLLITVLVGVNSAQALTLTSYDDLVNNETYVVNFDLNNYSAYVPSAFDVYLKQVRSDESNVVLNLYYSTDNLISNFNSNLNYISSMTISTGSLHQYIEWNLSNIDWQSVLAQDKTFSLAMTIASSDATVAVNNSSSPNKVSFITLNTAAPAPEPSGLILAIVSFVFYMISLLKNNFLFLKDY